MFLIYEEIGGNKKLSEGAKIKARAQWRLLVKFCLRKIPFNGLISWNF